MPAATITEALQVLRPAAGMAEGACLERFRRAAALLLGETTLHIAGHPHRFTEIELYLTQDAHPDPFTHRDPLQQTLGRWYFHRSGGRYRAGTYKGLDVSFGGAAAFGGILIRGIERLGAGGAGGATALIDGPCLVVDHILALAQQPSIDALVGAGAVAIEGDPRAPLVALRAPRAGAVTVYETPRIGLTLKRGNTPERRRFLALPYRFLTEPARIKKGKPHLVTALHQQGRSPAQIAALTGVRAGVVQGYLDAFEAGRRQARQRGAAWGDGLATLAGDLTPAQLCELLGACAAAREA